MAMTLRLDPELDAELRVAAQEDRRSVHQTVVLAIETFLALRETAEVLADPEALRALAEARSASGSASTSAVSRSARKVSMASTTVWWTLRRSSCAATRSSASSSGSRRSVIAI